MYDTLRAWFLLDDQTASQLRNDVLRWGVMALLLFVHLGTLFVALREGFASKRAPDPSPNPETPPRDTNPADPQSLPRDTNPADSKGAPDPQDSKGAPDPQNSMTPQNQFLLFGLLSLLLLVHLNSSDKKPQRETEGPQPVPPPKSPPATYPVQEGFLQQFWGVLFCLAIGGLIAAFPTLYEKGWHAWIFVAALAFGGLFFAQTRNQRLSLRIPERLGRGELVALGAFSILLVFSILIRWQDVPVGLNEDEAAFGNSAISMWRHRLHPFYLNPAGVTALHDTLDGLFIWMVGDPELGLRIQPLLWGVCTALLFFRWITWFASRQVAWFALLLFAATPAFQHYSRVPTGSSIYVSQMVFLYALTRALVVPGWRVPILGGLALGLSHWNYYATRSLALFALMVPFLLVPYYKKLAPRSFRRVFLILLVALPLILAFPLQKDYGRVSQWTWYMTGITNQVQGEPFSLDFWLLSIRTHFNMWFDATDNVEGWITVPGSPVLPYPLGVMALIGLGLLLLSLFSPLPILLLALLGCGVLGSMMSGSRPNGHRMLIAEIPCMVLLGIGMAALWPGQLRGFLAKSRCFVAIALTLWCCYVGLEYFHVDMVRDTRTIAAQQFSPHARARRLLRDINDYDIRVLPGGGTDVELLLLDGQLLQVLDWGNWLPLNWAPRMVSVQGMRITQSFASIGNYALSEGASRQIYDPAGQLSGWEYKTNGEKLGDEQVILQWALRKSVTGSVMIPASGLMKLQIPGFRFTVKDPIHPMTFVSQGEFAVRQGLVELTIESTVPDGVRPGVLSFEYFPKHGPSTRNDILAADLFSLPANGWLACDWYSPSSDPLQQGPSCGIYPFLSTVQMVQPITPPGTVRTQVFSSRISLPTGIQRFFLYSPEPPKAMQVLLDGKAVPLHYINHQTLARFDLDSVQANGKILQIVKVLERPVGEICLYTESFFGIQELPPYRWFTPVWPSAPVPLSTSAPAEPAPVPPAPAEPTQAASEPAATEATPVPPTPSDPVPVEPAPAEPAPEPPTSLDPTPVESTPLPPTPLDAAPAEPTPLPPTSLEPTPAPLGP